MKKQPIQLNSNTRNHFVIKPLSNFDLMDWIKRLGITHFRGIYSRDGLPKKIRKECGIINLDDSSMPTSFANPAGWDAIPSRYPSQYVASTHLYTWVKRDKVQ